MYIFTFKPVLPDTLRLFHPFLGVMSDHALLTQTFGNLPLNRFHIRAADDIAHAAVQNHLSKVEKIAHIIDDKLFQNKAVHHIFDGHITVCSA